MRSQKDKGERCPVGRVGWDLSANTLHCVVGEKQKNKGMTRGKQRETFAFQMTEPNGKQSKQRLDPPVEKLTSCSLTAHITSSSVPWSLPFSLFCVCLDFLLHLQYRALVYQVKDHNNCLQFVINNQSIDMFDMPDTSTNEKLEQSFHFESHRLSSSVFTLFYFKSFFLICLYFFFFLSFEFYLSQSTGRQFCMQKRRLMMATL